MNAIERWWDSLVLVGDEAFTPEEWAAIRHGTAGGYVRNGCRCDDCRAWRRRQPNYKEARLDPH